jgi:protein-S-isoprenylcysteine O-methyltransferase Ste14
MEESFWKGAYLVLLLAWFFMRMPYARRSRKTKPKLKKREDLEKLLVALNYIGMIFLPLFVVSTTRLDFATMGLPEGIRWLALLVYGLNLLFFLWCHKSLGKNWSSDLEIKEKHELVQEGPYKRIRHPMYTHFWLFVLSQGLILDNWIVLAYGVLAWGLLYFLRVGAEERMMIEEFGNEYKGYMKRTGRLLPKFDSRRNL